MISLTEDFVYIYYSSEKEICLKNYSPIQAVNIHMQHNSEYCMICDTLFPENTLPNNNRYHSIPKEVFLLLTRLCFDNRMIVLKKNKKPLFMKQWLLYYIKIVFFIGLKLESKITY